MNKIKSVLKNLRQTKGFSQAELARRARVHSSDISRFESGHAVPYPKQLARIARALRVSPSTLDGQKS